MNNIFISIVSHNHDDYIIDNEHLKKIVKYQNVFVIVKDNVNSKRLETECCKSGYLYVNSKKQSGFGENNNAVYSYCKCLGAVGDDWFICLNPDVNISVEYFDVLLSELKSSSNTASILSVDLYKDNGLTSPEQSLRYFPDWSNFFNLFLMRSVTRSYNKSELNEHSFVDWASGAFLIFRFSFFESLRGFDPSYFMYYEDVDICYRAKKKFGVSVKYLSKVKAVHSGAYKNRNLFSKHFRWYLVSLLKFLIRK